MVVGMPLLAAHAFTFLPLATLPVKATLASRLSELCDRKKGKFVLFSEHKGSLLRLQLGARLSDTLCLWPAGPSSTVCMTKSSPPYLSVLAFKAIVNGTAY